MQTRLAGNFTTQKLLARGSRVGLEFSKAEEIDLALLEDLHFLGIVPSMLDLANMSTTQHELAGTALTDTTADGLGKSSVKKHLVPNKILALRNMAQVQLLEQYLGVNADAHRRQLERLLKDRVPHQEISIEAKSTIRALRDPIIVVRGAAVMTKLSIFLHTTDTDEENGLVLLAQNVLALLGSGMRVLLDHVIRGSEVDLLGKDRFDTKLLLHRLLGVIKGLVDALDSLLQVLDVAILGINVLLPVELINVQGVGEVNVIVATKTAEISNKSLASLDTIVVKSPTLPLGKREGNLKMSAGEITRLKCGRTLGALCE